MGIRDIANKTAARIVGMTILGLILLALIWSFVGGIVKVYTPNYWGYSQLGWVHGGMQSLFGVTGVPKWAGMEGFASALSSPFRHYRVRLNQGQKIVVDYDVRIERGRMTVSVYPTNLFVLFQGVRVRGIVEDSKATRRVDLKRGRHKGTLEFTAPWDGIYRIRHQIWWDQEAYENGVIPLPDYDLVYDLRWRLERE